MAICAGTDLMFGLVRVFEGYLDETEWEIAVHRDRDEALQWLQGRVKEKFGLQINLF